MWGLLLFLFAAEALHELVGLGDSAVNRLFNWGVFNFLILAAAGICLLRAATIERLRGAWALIGLSLLSFFVGSVIWSVHYAELNPEPFPTASDAFWLAYYAFALGGLVLLARDRIVGFDLQRWIDGVAVALIAATPLVAVVLQPMVEEGTEGTTLARIVEFAYPIADILLLGAVLGIFALAGWRPGRTWLLLGLGLVLFGIADSISAVQLVEGTFEFGEYNYLWTSGALLIAYASWQPDPAPSRPVPLYGWKADHRGNVREFYRELQKKLLLRGSEEVIAAVGEWRQVPEDHPEDEIVWEKVIRTIRKDLGLSSSDLSEGDLLKVYVKNNQVDEYLEELRKHRAR